MESSPTRSSSSNDENGDNYVTLALLVGNTFATVDIEREADLSDSWDILKRKKLLSLSYNIGRYTKADVKYYTIEPPIRVADLNRIDDHVVSNAEEILRGRTKTRVRGMSMVTDTFDTDPDLEYVTLFVDVPQYEGTKLAKFDAEVLSCLLVKTRRNWSQEDLELNDASITILAESHAPPDVKAMMQRLSAPRRYTKLQEAQSRAKIKMCRTILKDQFESIFVSAESSADHANCIDVEDGVEFDHFWNLEPVTELPEANAPAVSLMMIKNYYLIPPTLSYARQGIAKYTGKAPWPFKLFVQLYTQPPRTNRPTSDFSFSSVDENMLFVVGTQASVPDESDRWQMLCEAVALSRLGNLLVKDSGETFAVMAIYINNALTTERYMIYQPDRSDLHVEIIREDFVLADPIERRRFLLGMYNFGFEMERFGRNINNDVYDRLRKCAWEAYKLQIKPLVWQKEWKSIKDVVHASKAAQRIVEQFALREKLTVLPKRPFTASVRSRQTGHLRYLKFIRSGESDEVSILSYLRQNSCLFTVRLDAFCHFDEGTLLLFPDMGVPVREYAHLSKMLLPITRHFLNGVAYLHEHKIAHCDLKTSNIAIDKECGVPTIIDFGLAVREMDELEGFRGTDDWVAPEVCVGKYDPYKADVWAAGKVLDDLLVRSSTVDDALYDVLEDLIAKMMAEDSMNRPTVKAAVDFLFRYNSDGAQSGSDRDD